MIVNMPNKEGVTLATEGKYCDENIEVVPTFEMSEGNTLNEYLKGTKTDITVDDLAGITEIRDYAFYYSPITSIKWGEKITSVGNRAFAYSGITSLVIVDSIVRVGEYTFQGCSNLISVKIGDGLIDVSRSLFADCVNLSLVELGKKLITIGRSAFSDCTSLRSIIIPKAVETIQAYAFQSCSALAEVVCLPETPPNLTNTSFNYVPENCIFKVKSASVEAYKSATNWSVRADYIIALTPEEEALYGS